MDIQFINQLLANQHKRFLEQQSEREFIYGKLPPTEFYSTMNKPIEEITLNVHFLPSWFGLEQPNKIPMPRHKHNYFELIYVYSGHFYNAIDKESYALGTENLILLNPNTIHAPYVQRDSDIVINILIQPSMIEKVLFQFVSKDNILFDFFANYIYTLSEDMDYLEIPRSQVMEMYIERMVVEYLHQDPQYEQSIAGALISLFAEMARNYKTRPTPSNNKHIINILNYIRNHCATINLQEIATLFNYSPTHISRLLKRETGYSFRDTLLNYKMESACNYLKNTNLRIEQIAYLLGFVDTGHFSRTFKNRIGVSPSKYRLSHKQILIE